MVVVTPSTSLKQEPVLVLCVTLSLFKFYGETSGTTRMFSNIYLS